MASAQAFTIRFRHRRPRHTATLASGSALLHRRHRRVAQPPLVSGAVTGTGTPNGVGRTLSPSGT